MFYGFFVFREKMPALRVCYADRASLSCHTGDHDFLLNGQFGDSLSSLGQKTIW